MVPYRNRNDRDYISTVNITPFTDGVLVILIVFMISAPGILSSHLDILLPGSSVSRDAKRPDRIVGIDSEGDLFFNESRLNEQKLTEKIHQIVKDDPDAKILLNADKRVPHGRVVEILDLLRKEGIRGTYVGAVRK